MVNIERYHLIIGRIDDGYAIALHRLPLQEGGWLATSPPHPIGGVSLLSCGRWLHAQASPTEYLALSWPFPVHSLHSCSEWLRAHIALGQLLILSKLCRNFRYLHLADWKAHAEYSVS